MYHIWYMHKICKRGNLKKNLRFCSYFEVTNPYSKNHDSPPRIFMPRIEWSGAYCFCPVCLFVCLSVCLSVVNFNIHYNFWTLRDRGFIFGVHTQLMVPFQVTPRSMTLTLTSVLKITFSDSVAARGIVFHKHTLTFFFFFYIFLAHLTLRLKWAIVIVRRPLSVRKLSHFQLLLQNRLMDFDETW